MAFIKDLTLDQAIRSLVMPVDQIEEDTTAQRDGESGFCVKVYRIRPRFSYTKKDKIRHVTVDLSYLISFNRPYSINGSIGFYLEEDKPLASRTDRCSHAFAHLLSQGFFFHLRNLPAAESMGFTVRSHDHQFFRNLKRRE